MLLRQKTLAGVSDGRITIAFRRWKRPTVKAGGVLLTSIGQLAIDGVEAVRDDALTLAEARAAGFESVDALTAALGPADKGTIYRVRFRLAGPDPRIALREVLPDETTLETIVTRLERWDEASPVGVWTGPVVALLRDKPGTRAGDLAEELGMDKARFKTNVRKLKGLGLTESLEVGYRLSPRGQAVARHLEESG